MDVPLAYPLSYSSLETQAKGRFFPLIAFILMTWHYETDCEETPKREKSNDESKGEDLNNKNNSSSILLRLCNFQL